MTGFERWESLILFIIWGLICYIWGYSEGEPKRNKYSYQPKLPTKKPNITTPTPPPMCKGGWNPPPTTPRPINPPPGQGRKDN